MYNHSSVGKTLLLQGTEQERHAIVNRLIVADAEKVAIIVCLGGRTGSHFAPLAVRLAKLAGKSPVCAVTLPFDFEGERCKALANKALQAIKECTPDVQVFNNEELNARHRDLGITDAFKRIDAQVAEALLKMLVQ